MTASTITIHQDKGGKFRSTDKETFRKLRKVRFFAHVSRIQQARHERWARKLPQNRIRWVFDGFYAPNALAISFTKWKSEPWAEPEQCPTSLLILEREYQNARKRWDSPEEVVPMKLDPIALDDMLKSLYGWSDRVYGHRQ